MALPSLVSETAKLDAFFWHLSFWACSGDLSSSPGFFRDVHSAAMMLLILFCWQKMPRKSLAMITQLSDVLSVIIHPKPLTSLVLQISPCQLFLLPSKYNSNECGFCFFIFFQVTVKQLSNLRNLWNEVFLYHVCLKSKLWIFQLLVVLAVMMFIIIFCLNIN